MHHFYLISYVLIFSISFLGYPPGSFAEDTGITYEVTIKGVADKALHALLEEVSNTLALKDRPPASLGLLRRRVDKEPRTAAALLPGQCNRAARVVHCHRVKTLGLPPKTRDIGDAESI